MIKVGMYLPVYGGWYNRRANEKETPPSYSYVKKAALEAESIGIDSLWIPDHLLNPRKGARAPSLEAWTVAVAIAEATKRVALSHTVLCEAFRHPAVLAKQAASLAEISSNRFWLSIGAGWYKREYDSYGLTFYEHDERVARAQEAIQLIKRLWQEETVTFSGKYYSVTDGILEPKPCPIPPIWYAGMSHASRELVAAEADAWLMRGCSLEEARSNVAELNELVMSKGRNKIEFGMASITCIRDTEKEARNYVEKVDGENSELLSRTLATGLVGTAETVAIRIRQFEEAGINHILLQLTPTLEEIPRVAKVLDILKKAEK